MENFAAIDFETANREASSVCSVGVVIVRGGEISERIYRLIHPEPDYYLYWNTRVHGLRAEDTSSAPLFPDVWKEIAPRIEGLPLVAHNSPFDERCLKAAFRTYGMDYPDYTFYCTCRASRRTFGKELPNHQLQTVAAHCGYDLAHHHHALADAEACAWIALRILPEPLTPPCQYTVGELRERVKQSLRDIENGNTQDADEVLKEMETW